jgi:hypothetical protein
MTESDGKFAEAATLHGVAPLSDAYPGFAVPLFKRQRSDAIFAQTISADGAVEDFELINVGDHVVKATPTEVSVGEEPIAAFIINEENILIERVGILRSRLASQPLMSSLKPFTKFQVAHFCRLPEETLSPIKLEAFDYLHKLSPESAALWRNIVVLLPAIRSTIVGLLGVRKEGEFRSDIASINCRVVERELSVGLTGVLLKEKEQAGEERWKDALLNILAIDFKTFNIDSISFREWISKEEQDVDDVDIPLEPTDTELELLKLIGDAMGELNLSHRNCRIVDLTVKRDAKGTPVEALGRLVYLEPKPRGFAGPKINTFLASFTRDGWRIARLGFG